jgi:hypothetical protein
MNLVGVDELHATSDDVLDSLLVVHEWPAAHSNSLGGGIMAAAKVPSFMP